MASDVQWFEKPLGEVTVNHDGKRKPVKESERKKGQFPYYGASGIVDHVDGYLFEGRHLLIAEDGENLRTRQTPIAFIADGRFWVNNHAHIVTGSGEVTTEYLHYFLQSADIQPYLTGAVMPKLTQGNLNKIPIRYPKPNYQKSIVRVLGALDAKIDLNRRINQTLEAMAQAIFKSWFVDFDPVKAKIAAKAEGRDPLRAAMSAISGKAEDELDGLPTEQYEQLAATAALFPDAMVESELGEIPEGWEIKALGGFLTIKRGGSPRPIQDFMAPSGLPWVKIADATAEPSPFLFGTREFIKESGLKKTVYLKSGALILTNSATPGLPKFLELDACIHDGWLYFPEKRMFTDQYLYFLFQKIRSALVAQGNGSVFTNLKTDILKGQRVLVPSQEVMTSFTILASSILENIKILSKECASLVSLRDTLLPKLLSGELSVAELD